MKSLFFNQSRVYDPTMGRALTNIQAEENRKARKQYTELPQRIAMRTKDLKS